MQASTIGILGGGQLGRMMGHAAQCLGMDIMILDPLGPASPAGLILPPEKALTGSFNEDAKIDQLASKCDILTVEIEHVNVEYLKVLENQGKIIHPSPSTIELIQDKYNQKVFLQSLGIPVASFKPIKRKEDLISFGKEFGFPYMLKCRRWSYDGKGNAVVRDVDSIDDAWKQLSGSDENPNLLYAEQWVPYEKELAIMIVRGKDQLDAFPVVETIQENSICHSVLVPAQITEHAKSTAKEMSMKAIENLKGQGIFGVELFITKEGNVYLNEIAPRPHNSGHYTIEACETSQFEQHLRAVASLLLGSCELKVGAAMMVNILGGPQAYDPFYKALAVPGASLHHYGKKENRVGRKLAHLTVVAPSMNELFGRVNAIDSSYTKPYQKSGPAKVGIIMGSDSDLPSMKAAADIMELFEIPYELSIVSAHRTPQRMFDYARNASNRGLKVLICGAGGAAHLPGMVAALTHLPVIGVPIKTSTLNGQDSLLSIVQMPRGVPVATVAIGNSTNAGLLAVRMLGIEKSYVAEQMKQYLLDQEQQVHKKIDSMESSGWKIYLENM